MLVTSAVSFSMDIERAKNRADKRRSTNTTAQAVNPLPSTIKVQSSGPQLPRLAPFGSCSADYCTAGADKPGTHCGRPVPIPPVPVFHPWQWIQSPISHTLTHTGDGRAAAGFDFTRTASSRAARSPSRGPSTG
ncbi:hypothetical protein G7046_g4097 [Stylonectria norvegica]|nr:hypothetical protein G7046_g4097 [Stylonectria norvegica]